MLKQGKSENIQETVAKYGLFFIQEYKHFINVHNLAFPSQFSDMISEFQRPNIPELDENEHVIFSQNHVND